ncbi:MAG: hypothetical protein WC670_15745 [Pseudolabrys sp.]|jgi:hypothetical protein
MRYLGLGFIAGVTWLYVLAQIPMRPWLLFVIAIASMIAAIAAWRYGGRKAARPAIGFTTASVIVVAGAIYMAKTVMNQAEVSATGRPFCIQVASPSDYSPARTLLDLSPMTMRAATASGHSMTHHAILVVQEPSGEQLLHWSYRRRQFIPGVVNERTPGYGPAIVCEPEKDFAQHLPNLIAGAVDSVFVRFSDREAYRIPLIYRPRWSGGPGRYLALQMVPPEFTPSASTSERQSDEVFIQWNSGWLTALLQAPPSAAIRQQDSAYGLIRQIFAGGHTRYASDTGADTTLIDCYGGNNSAPLCQHRFLNGGRHIRFTHRPEDVPHWRELQARLVARLASFSAAAAEPTPPSSRP